MIHELPPAYYSLSFLIKVVLFGKTFKATSNFRNKPLRQCWCILKHIPFPTESGFNRGGFFGAGDGHQIPM